MTASRSQGEIGIERSCQLTGISRSGYYRHWQRSAPRQEDTGLRDAIQRLALKHRHYGYRRIGALLRREGWQANHKRVLRRGVARSFPPGSIQLSLTHPIRRR